MPDTTPLAKSREARRHIRRRDQIKWVTAVACVLAAFSVIFLVLAGSDGRDAPGRTAIRSDRPSRSANAGQQRPGDPNLGKVLSQNGETCREMIFDNATGQSQDGGVVACEDPVAGGRYSYPAARLKSISKQFSKE